MTTTVTVSRGLLALLLLATFAAVSQAGDLEPPGPPAPTMRTLDEVTGAWSRTLDSTNGDVSGCDSSRFKCVLNGEAVLDLETGLVWERTFINTQAHPLGANAVCGRRLVGGRGGWRLPTLGELVSLLLPVDPGAPPAEGTVLLPSGHPFIGPFAGLRVWTSTIAPVPNDTGRYYYQHRLSYQAADAELSWSEDNTIGGIGYWCVRGATSK